MKINQRKSGVILSYLSEGVHILSVLLYTPIMLRLLGQSEYGLYQLVYSVVSYMSLLSFGFSSSYMRFYSRYKKDNDESAIAKLNGMFMMIFLVISCICILCGAVMIINIKSIFGTGLTESEYVTARILMVLMVINLALTFPNSVFVSITSSKERFFFQKMLIVLQNILNPFITLPLLLMGYGSVAMVVVTTGLTLAKLIVNAGYCKQKLHTKFDFKAFDFRLLQEMAGFTFFIFINMIVDQVNWSIGKFLLGRMMGTAMVAVFGVGVQLNNMYMQFSTSVSSVFIPKVNRLVVQEKDNIKLSQLFTKVGRVQFMILALIFTGFVFLGKPFVQIWAGPGYESVYSIALMLLGPITVPLIQNLGIEIQRAKNMHKARSYVYLCIAVGNVLISIPCIRLWGAKGAAFGTSFALFLGNGVFMNWYYHNKIGLDMKFFWKQILSFVPALVVPVAVGIWMMLNSEINGVISLGIYVVVYAAVYCVSMFFLGMNKTEKDMVWSPVEKILGKRIGRRK